MALIKSIFSCIGHVKQVNHVNGPDSGKGGGSRTFHRTSVTLGESFLLYFPQNLCFRQGPCGFMPSLTVAQVAYAKPKSIKRGTETGKAHELCWHLLGCGWIARVLVAGVPL